MKMHLKSAVWLSPLAFLVFLMSGFWASSGQAWLGKGQGATVLVAWTGPQLPAFCLGRVAQNTRRQGKVQFWRFRA